MLARNPSNCYSPKILTKRVRQKSVTEPATWFIFQPWTWTKKGGAEFAEFSAVAIATVCAASATQLNDPVKSSFTVAAAGFAFVAFVAKCLSKRLEDAAKDVTASRNRDRARRVARVMLEGMQRYYFKDEEPINLHKHRFTLFQAIEGMADGKRLVVFARAGDHADSKSSWTLDDGKFAGCRGVAGEVWYTKTTIFREAVCDWPVGNADPDAKMPYAESLKSTIAEVEPLNVKSRAFAGVMVSVGGERWGVLLLDSLTAGVLPETPTRKLLLNHYASVLGMALAEANS